jgi:hypothetical protein
MQTFLPYPDFAQTAACLDYRRLGKQRVEAWQILRAITLGDYPNWHHHPAVRMWRGYPDALGVYMNACIDEWIGRGYRNTMAHHIITARYEAPPWLGNGAFHASHRAALLYKYPEYYSQFGWSEAPEWNYVWPVKGGSASAALNG